MARHFIFVRKKRSNWSGPNPTHPSASVIRKGLLQFFLRIHHKGTMPRDWLVVGDSAQDEKSCGGLFIGRDRESNGRASGKDGQLAVFDVLSLRSDQHVAGKDIDANVVVLTDVNGGGASGLYGPIMIHDGGVRIDDGLEPQGLARDDSNRGRSIRRRRSGYLIPRDFLVSRMSHFQPRR